MGEQGTGTGSQGEAAWAEEFAGAIRAMIEREVAPLQERIAALEEQMAETNRRWQRVAALSDLVRDTDRGS